MLEPTSRRARQEGPSHAALRSQAQPSPPASTAQQSARPSGNLQQDARTLSTSALALPSTRVPAPGSKPNRVVHWTETECVPISRYTPKPDRLQCAQLSGVLCAFAGSL